MWTLSIEICNEIHFKAQILKLVKPRYNKLMTVEPKVNTHGPFFQTVSIAHSKICWFL